MVVTLVQSYFVRHRSKMNKFQVGLICIFCSICQFVVSGDVIDCPCSDISLCQPIEDITRKEVFIFSLRNVEAIWSKYDWTKVTTIVPVGYVNSHLMCFAHKHGARVVTIANIPKTLLPNKTARANWVQKELQFVKDNFLDGINIDFEDFILQNETTYRDGYTALVTETFKAFKEASPYYQVTVDVAWSPNGIDLRYYDYIELAKVSDFLFVMAYDEQSQITGPCVAGPNSPLPNSLIGIKQYLLLGIPYEQLVIGVPWYGYLYTCLDITGNDTCHIKHVPFRGVDCSDAAGTQINYYQMKDYLEYSKEGLKWNSVSHTPYFTLSINNKTLQVQFDDPKSLGLKYNLVKEYGIRGLGMWNADAVDYISNTTEAIKERTEMWAAIPVF